MSGALITHTKQHLEYDLTKCSVPTISWALSALSYDHRVNEYIHELFRNFKTRSWSFDHGAQFFGIAYDEVSGRIFDWHRGTDDE